MTPKITIIMPCYNCEDTLRQAVDSCYQQGFSDDAFEIVMVDDGSSDGTWELLQTLEKEHSNIRIFQHEENKGGGAARNTAVRHAQADVIFCLDSDDVLFSNTLTKMHSYLLEKKADGVAFNYSTKFRGNDIADIALQLDLSVYKERAVPLDSLLGCNGVHSPVVINFMYTKDAWEKAGGYPEYHGFDTQGFGWRFLTSGLEVYVCPGANYLHRIDYHDSYYLREYYDGKTNLNWRCLLYENIDIFTPEAQVIIKTFNYRDFTKDITKKLCSSSQIFLDGVIIRKRIIPDLELLEPIKPKSFWGLLLRIKKRIFFFKK